MSASWAPGRTGAWNEGGNPRQGEVSQQRGVSRGGSRHAALGGGRALAGIFREGGGGRTVEFPAPTALSSPPTFCPLQVSSVTCVQPQLSVPLPGRTLPPLHIQSLIKASPSVSQMHPSAPFQHHPALSLTQVEPLRLGAPHQPLPTGHIRNAFKMRI